MALGAKEEAIRAALALNVTIGTSETTVLQLPPPPFNVNLPGVEDSAIEVIGVSIMPRANMGSGNNLSLTLTEIKSGGTTGSSASVTFTPVNSGVPVFKALSSVLKLDIGSGLKVTGSHASAGVAQDVAIWYRISGEDLPLQRLVVSTQNV